MKQHHIGIQWKESLKFEAEAYGQKLMLDGDATPGELSTGFRPKPLLLISLAGCTGMDVASLLKKMRVEFSDFTIDVDGELTEDHPQQYTRVHITYQIKIKPEDRDKMEKAVNLSKERYCGVSFMFKKFSTLTSEIVYL
ncbi:MAG: OsmC family protein [Flavobacteriales bacterium]|nr:OsmC family protein [Flavobacteriales bacterium]